MPEKQSRSKRVARPLRGLWHAPGSVRDRLQQAQRLVVKLGTHVVTRDGVELALARVIGLVESMANMRRDGRQVILVSSGAIGFGSRLLGLRTRPTSLGLRQACAAVGQGRLIGMYIDAFAQLGVTAAQVLLSQGDLADPDRALCLRTTLLRLMELGVVPILNENDSVSVRELVAWRRREGDNITHDEAFGDNDGLSARVAASLDADLLVLLTDVDAVYTARPDLDPDARPIDVLDTIDETVIERASGGSKGGTGGMASKLLAACRAHQAGVDVVIANGTRHGILERVLAGESVGTWLPARDRLPAKRRHIALEAPCRGALIINAGAVQALIARKASLLPIGVTAVEGEFRRGEVVELRDGGGRVLGRGLANYSAEECRKLSGRHSDDIADVLGFRGYDALITRDNLVLAERTSARADEPRPADTPASPASKLSP